MDNRWFLVDLTGVWVEVSFLEYLEPNESRYDTSKRAIVGPSIDTGHYDIDCRGVGLGDLRKLIDAI